MKLLVLLFLALVNYAMCYVLPEEGQLFEGDMELTPDQREAIEVASHNKFAAIRDRLWLVQGEAETIRYYIDPKIEKGAAKPIAEAVEEYHKKTCIRFERVDKIPRFSPHIFFTEGKGCSSPVGRRDYQNAIKLAPGCWHKGIIIHEMGHSLGFHHEQSRPDRDEFVDIIWENIDPKHVRNFKLYGYDRIDSRGFPYDYDSVMHYGGRSFAIDRKQYTIKTKKPQDQRRIGQRYRLSVVDAAQLRRMYYCKKTA